MGISPEHFVVLSDRYPPHSHGGAELSLHAILRSVVEDRPVQVIALNGTNETVRQYEHQGVAVIELPGQAPWPVHSMSAAKWATLQRRAKWIADYILRREAKNCIGKLAYLDSAEKARLLQLFLGKKITGGLSIDRQEFSAGFTRRRLRALFRDGLPRKLHADNYRAICHAGLLNVAGWTATVRDHRFDCARHNQSRIIGSKVCGACDFSCTEQDCPEDSDLLRKVIEDNVQFRRRSIAKAARRSGTSVYLTERLRDVTRDPEVLQVSNPVDAPRWVRGVIRGVSERVGFNAVIVGMLTENKGQTEFIKTLGHRIAAEPDFHVHFAGRGPRIERRIKELAAGFGIEDRVHLHGFVGRRNLYELMRECQVVLLPTRWPEPFGRVPLEAGLARRPVVSFKIGGLAESIVDKSTGYLVNHLDFGAMFDRALSLRDDPAARMEMGASAYEYVRRKYSQEVVEDNMATLWG